MTDYTYPATAVKAVKLYYRASYSQLMDFSRNSLDTMAIDLLLSPTLVTSIPNKKDLLEEIEHRAKIIHEITTKETRIIHSEHEIEDYINKLPKRLAVLDKEFEKYATEMVKDPMHFFQWGEQPMKDAARRQLLLSAIRILDLNSETGEAITGRLAIETLFKFVSTEVLHIARDCSPNSSSACSNLMKLFALEVYTEERETLEWIIKSLPTTTNK